MAKLTDLIMVTIEAAVEALEEAGVVADAVQDFAVVGHLADALEDLEDAQRAVPVP